MSGFGVNRSGPKKRLSLNCYNSVMSEKKSYPENVPGHFYVEADLCILCGTPAGVSPDLVARKE
jgi:NAD-dependent dihydropyrimidine dehydrogenase PreA subunit